MTIPNNISDPTGAVKRYEENLAKAKARGNKTALPALTPVRHPQQDFFLADILDVSIKDDLASMEHPFFALKAGDRRVRYYERNGNTLTIKPGTDGCATVHDKDVWIYCTSQMIEAGNRGCSEISRTVRFTAHDFLLTTNRSTAGVGYKRMSESLARLAGTRIETSVETDGQRERAGFGLIDSWRVIEKTKGGKMVAVEVTLPEWLHRSIQAKQVLTLSRDYFRIRKPLNRRIYEIARKHCGQQRQWQCTVRTLYEKSGSTEAIRNFKVALRELAESNDMPDYSLSLNDDDMVMFVRQ